jgi:hypothetical protein
MNKKTVIGIGCLIASLMIGLSSVSAAEKINTDPNQPIPKPDAMFKEDQGANFGQQLGVLANSWKQKFACGDPYFFYTIPGKALAAKITPPTQIKGKSTAIEVDSWPAAAAKGKAGGMSEKQLTELLDKVIAEAYK